jgi:hypothetical protein
MRKSVLIIDTPDSCCDCRFCRELDEGIEACCELMEDEDDPTCCRMIETESGYCQEKPIWCPLKELPERRKYSEEFFNGNVKGWNDCLGKIVGE